MPNKMFILMLIVFFFLRINLIQPADMINPKYIKNQNETVSVVNRNYYSYLFGLISYNVIEESKICNGNNIKSITFKNYNLINNLITVFTFFIITADEIEVECAE